MDPHETSHPPDTSKTVELIHTIKEEIDALSEQQADALKAATYLAMTPEEARQYDSRRERVTELIKKSEMLQRAL